MYRFTFLLCFSLTVAGCGTLENRYSPEKLKITDVNSNHGVVVLSTGAAERCISTATFLNMAGDGAASSSFKKVSMNVDGYAVKSDFESHQGNIHSFILVPGSYLLSPSIANPYVIATSTPIFKFEINAGERLYLGEYFMPVACSFNNVSLFLDQYERDMALLKSKNPDIANETFEKRAPVFFRKIEK